MTNKEKFREILEDFAMTDTGLAVVNGEPVDCAITCCERCLFKTLDGCTGNKLEWLRQEYEEPEVDWSKVPVDTKILVKQNDQGSWNRRHFAKYENGCVYAFGGGTDLWTSDGNVTDWKYAKLAEDGE